MPSLSSCFLILKVVVEVLGLSISHLTRYLQAQLHLFTYHPSPTPRNVVVIGASFGGYSCAEQLARSLPSGWRVVVIEKNSHFNYTWLFPRITVIPRHAEKAFVPYPTRPRIAPEGSYTFVNATVSEVKLEERKVLLETGEEILYEHLVIATGMPTRYPYVIDGRDKKEGIAYFEKCQEDLKTAKRVAVVGGGPVGVEIALDVKSLYPDKNVTLIHSRDRLVNNYGQKLHEHCLQALEKLQIDVVLAQRVQQDSQAKQEGNEGGEVLRFSNGEILECDLIISCIGQKGALNSLRGLSALSSSNGLLAVDQNLQAAEIGSAKVFAIGDAADTGILKMGRAAALQGIHAADNIVRHIRGKKLKAFSAGVVENSIDLTIGLDKHLIHICDTDRAINMVQKTQDETVRAEVMWKMLGAKPFEDIKVQ